MLFTGCLALTVRSPSARVTDLQRRVAAISEMIHTSSLIHDDVIDNAEIRRSKISVNRKVSFVQISSNVAFLKLLI